jgi:bla regulator protein blaR1
MSDVLRILPFAADHVWQSTLFAASVALLTLAFRRQRAGVRYALWLAASIKFLVPFALLVALGSSLHWTAAPLPQPELRLAVDVASLPFTPLASADAPLPTAPVDQNNPWLARRVRALALRGAAFVWIAGTCILLLRWGVQWLQLRRLLRRGVRLTSGREADLLRAAGGSDDLPIVQVDSSIEPGIVGAVRPVLLWPATISARLDDEQMTAVMAHELAHVARRDNLSAAVHMATEALFWWHPLVWWVGARLVDERERACDEDVLRGGREPQRYAESILRTCEFYLEAPLACVTGVTGADLKKRIETIMRNHPSAATGRARKLLLATVAIAAFAAPIAVGVMRAPRLLAAQEPSSRRFDVISIKRNTSGAQGGTNQNPPGRYTATNISLRMLIRGAYGLLDSQILSGPKLATAEYFTAEKFDINATYTGEATRDERAAMMRNLLADRFKVVAHTEMREMPVYVLSQGRPDGSLGPQLKPAADPTCSSPAAQQQREAARAGGTGAGMPGRGGRGGPQACGTLQFGPGTFIGKSAGFTMLVDSLSNRTPITGIDRPVLDRTGLTGPYDFELVWRMPPAPAGTLPAGVTPPPIDPDRPDLFTALQEQLGLKLEPQRAPIEVLIVDSAEMPSEN